MKKKFLGFLGALFMMLSINTSAEAMGLFYTNANYPIIATGVTSPADLSALKKGESSAVNILFFVEIGDAGINKAVKDANIKKINFIDINEKTVFIFFRKITTTVYGE